MAERVWVRVGGTVSHSTGAHDRALPTAAFDFDSTLRPHRGRGPGAAATTLAFLVRLSEMFNLVIVSNGAAAAAPSADLVDYVAALDRGVGRPGVTVYVPHARDRYRKPHTGTWEHYVNCICAGVHPWFAFFCGDAAGRPGDHSAADYMYALNIGIPFITAESLFGGGITWSDPASLGCAAPAPAGLLAALSPSPPAPAGLLAALSPAPAPRLRVVLVGSPASGKSYVARRSGLRIVSRDVEGGGFWRALAAAVGGGESFIVDATNPKRKDRERLAALLVDAAFAFEVWHIATPKAVCIHLNAARCQLGERNVPAVAIHTYWARREPPGADEGADLGYTPREIPFSLSPAAPREVTAFRYCA